MSAQGHHHYKLVDVGTFGGPQSWIFSPGVVLRLGLLNNQGALAGSADTSGADPYCFWGDCYATNAFQWKNGVMTDLGVLPGGIGSQVNSISANGLMVGIADNGQQDPLNPGLPQVHAVLWQGGTMTDLGIFMGGYDTWATSVNSRGEIVGLAYNTIPDPDSLYGYGYQLRAFYWNNGVVQDLGTLGTGNDAAAGVINERGQVLGVSYTSSTPDSSCTIGNPFLPSPPVPSCGTRKTECRTSAAWEGHVPSPTISTTTAKSSEYQHCLATRRPIPLFGMLRPE